MGSERFDLLSQAQRGAPERAMLRASHSQISQLYGYILEHVGDLTHRMSAMAKYGEGGHEAVGEKVRKTLNFLRHPYGFEREVSEQIRTNLRVNKERGRKLDRDFEDELAELKRLGQDYSDAHSELPVFNEAQIVARDAAVALGEWRFDDVVSNLEILELELANGRESWNEYSLSDPTNSHRDAVQPTEDFSGGYGSEEERKKQGPEEFRLKE